MNAIDVLPQVLGGGQLILGLIVALILIQAYFYVRGKNKSQETNYQQLDMYLKSLQESILQELYTQSIRYAEDKLGAGKGEEKLKLAISQAVVKAKEYGIEVTEAQVEVGVRAAFQALKQGIDTVSSS